MPQAGEATITHVPRAGTAAARPLGELAKSAAPTGVSCGRRAVGVVRRYCRANRLDRLATLTYATEPPDRATLVAHWRRFLERFQKRFGRRPVVAVIERGAENGRLHIHLALGFYVGKRVLAKLWGRGFVDIRKKHSGERKWRQRELAGYLAKYVSKEVDQEAAEDPKERAEREHRYFCTQGFKPATWRIRYGRIGQAYERLRGLYGAPDLELPFGEWAPGEIFGVFYSFPDGMLHPPPGHDV